MERFTHWMLADVRHRLGLTQAEVAVRRRVSRTTQTRAESCGNPTLATISDTAAALGARASVVWALPDGERMVYPRSNPTSGPETGSASLDPRRPPWMTLFSPHSPPRRIGLTMTEHRLISTSTKAFAMT